MILTSLIVVGVFDHGRGADRLAALDRANCGRDAAATHATASAYVADISTSEEKAARFGLVGAAFGMGFVLGPVLGGLLIGPRAPFYAAAALAALNALSCAICCAAAADISKL